MDSSCHAIIDARLYELIETSVRKIDAHPSLRARMHENVARWPDERLRLKWKAVLNLPWAQLKSRLLARDDAGSALRQEAPLAGILSNSERLIIMRKYSVSDDTRAA